MTEKEKFAIARDADIIFRKNKNDGLPKSHGLHMEVCYCDRILWRDDDGNYWEEYVPTYDW